MTKEALNMTVDIVLTFWEMARIKTNVKHNCVSKLDALFEEWLSLRKCKNRKDDSGQGHAREIFRKKLDSLWDIGHQDAIEDIRGNRLLSAEDKEEDIQFYQDQRGARTATMSGNVRV